MLSPLLPTRCNAAFCHISAQSCIFMPSPAQAFSRTDVFAWGLACWIVKAHVQTLCGLKLQLDLCGCSGHLCACDILSTDEICGVMQKPNQPARLSSQKPQQSVAKTTSNKAAKPPIAARPSSNTTPAASSAARPAPAGILNPSPSPARPAPAGVVNPSPSIAANSAPAASNPTPAAVKVVQGSSPVRIGQSTVPHTCSECKKALEQGHAESPSGR